MVASPSPRTTASKCGRNVSGSQVGSGPPATSRRQRPRRRVANQRQSSSIVAMHEMPTTSAFAASAMLSAWSRRRKVQSRTRTSWPASRRLEATYATPSGGKRKRERSIDRRMKG